jgi:KEOPS complex subunit Cgi121
MIEIVGARGTIKDIDVFLQKLLEFATKEQIVIQAVNAKVVYGKEHLVSAVDHALRAFAQETNSTNSLALEILLYAAGERQIQKAIKKMGVKIGRQPIAFVIVDTMKRRRNRKAYDSIIDRLLDTFHMKFDETVLEGNRDTLKDFGIKNHEIRTVPAQKYGDLILEKVAMVDVLK